MIEIPVITKVICEVYKIGQHFKNKKKDERMRTKADELRRLRTHAVNPCLRPVIGSEEDRFYSEMVAKGYLTRVFGGYMLPGDSESSYN